MKKDYTNYLVERASKYIDEKKVINESVKYPTQEDAELACELLNFYTGLSEAGTSRETKELVEKIGKVISEILHYAFSEKSPWTKKNKNGKFNVAWSSEKAKKLGLEK